MWVELLVNVGLPRHFIPRGSAGSLLPRRSLRRSSGGDGGRLCSEFAFGSIWEKQVPVNKEKWAGLILTHCRTGVIRHPGQIPRPVRRSFSEDGSGMRAGIQKDLILRKFPGFRVSPGMTVCRITTQSLEGEKGVEVEPKAPALNRDVQLVL